MGFPPLWQRMILECVTLVSYKILMNGGQTKSFFPKGRLRQDDPLSLYTGILLSMEENKTIEGVKISRQVLIINHLFYIDDLIIFFKANTNSCSKLNDILRDFGAVSSLLINHRKYELIFS